MSFQGELATPEFRKWFDSISEKIIKDCAKVLFEENEMVAPTMIIFGNEGQVKSMLVPMEPDHKDMVFNSQKVAAQVFFAAVIVSEVWVVATDIPVKVSKYESLADHPGREEGVMISAMQKKQQLIATYRINRDKRELDKPMVVDPVSDATSMKGRAALNEPTEH